MDRVLSRGRSETGGLDSEILIKINTRVMISTNIDITDRLINGQMGTVTKVSTNNNTRRPAVIYIKFDDTSRLVSKLYKSIQINMLEKTTVCQFNQYLQELKSDQENHLHQKCKDCSFLLH